MGSSADMAQLATHQHGKGQVRVGRVWRDGDTSTFVEWKVDTVLESDMAHAFLTGSNEGMTATDTQKNTVYYVAKQMKPNASPEDFALALAKHFVKTYDPVSKARVNVSQAPWSRHEVDGTPHSHGYTFAGTGVRTAYAAVDVDGKVEVQGGITDWKLLKTTQSGYEGYIKDEYTMLNETKDRMLASSVTSTWKYSGELDDYHAPFESAKAAMAEAFFGPVKEGVYSPSVQFTMYNMGKGAIEATEGIESVYLFMPNIHFLPCSPVNTKGFENDVFVATSEPFGTIQCTITRGEIKPHKDLTAV